MDYVVSFVHFIFNLFALIFFSVCKIYIISDASVQPIKSFCKQYNVMAFLGTVWEFYFHGLKHKNGLLCMMVCGLV